jgi:hypothetical protein
VDDDTQEQTQPGYLEPIDAYNRALSAFGIELDALATAITEQAVDLVFISAHDAVIVLLAAGAAYRRLARTLANAPPLLEMAKLGLVERHSALLELFAVAEANSRGIPRLAQNLALGALLAAATANKKTVDVDAGSGLDQLRVVYRELGDGDRERHSNQ